MGGREGQPEDAKAKAKLQLYFLGHRPKFSTSLVTCVTYQA
jgi:hypothetical protein